MVYYIYNTMALAVVPKQSKGTTKGMRIINSWVWQFTYHIQKIQFLQFYKHTKALTLNVLIEIDDYFCELGSINIIVSTHMYQVMQIQNFPPLKLLMTYLWYFDYSSVILPFQLLVTTKQWENVIVHSLYWLFLKITNFITQ